MAHYRCFMRTDVGMRRDHNEDSYLANEDLGLYAVCDGMGGHAGGETASRLAVQTIEREVLSSRLRSRDPARPLPLERSPLAETIREAVEGACAAVHRTAAQYPELQGMGTTCTALLVHDGQAILGHVGDSRGYLLRDGTLTQITEDHSLVNEQVRAGLLTESEAKTSRLRNIITRSVGSEEDVLVDVVGVETRPGDKVLLCSDGLSNLVEAEEMRDVLLRHPAADAPERLVQLANERGGDDNITVLVVERLD